MLSIEEQMKDNNKMGEQAVFPQNNAPNDQNEEDMEEDHNESEEEDDLEDMSQEGTNLIFKTLFINKLMANNIYIVEFNALNNKMDELNSALDNIEQKNEVIYSELLKLLQANREIREQMESQSQTAKASKSSEQ